MVASCNLITGADQLASTPITDEDTTGSTSSGEPLASDGGSSERTTTTTPPDASTSDDGLDATADVNPSVDAGVDAGTNLPNLVVNPGFEAPGQDCGPGWYPWRSTAERVSGAHSGAYACRVCKNPSEEGPEFTINSTEDIDPTAKIGDRYRASAWVRRAGGVPTTVELYLRFWNGRDGHVIGVQDVVLGDAWKYVEVEGTVNGPSTQMDVFVATAGTRATDCFLVDDISVVRLP